MCAHTMAKSGYFDFRGERRPSSTRGGGAAHTYTRSHTQREGLGEAIARDAHRVVDVVAGKTSAFARTRRPSESHIKCEGVLRSHRRARARWFEPPSPSTPRGPRPLSQHLPTGETGSLALAGCSSGVWKRITHGRAAVNSQRVLLNPGPRSPLHPRKKSPARAVPRIDVSARTNCHSEEDERRRWPPRASWAGEHKRRWSSPCGGRQVPYVHRACGRCPIWRRPWRLVGREPTQTNKQLAGERKLPPPQPLTLSQNPILIFATSKTPFSLCGMPPFPQESISRFSYSRRERASLPSHAIGEGPDNKWSATNFLPPELPTAYSSAILFPNCDPVAVTPPPSLFVRGAPPPHMHTLALRTPIWARSRLTPGPPILSQKRTRLVTSSALLGTLDELVSVTRARTNVRTSLDVTRRAR